MEVYMQELARGGPDVSIRTTNDPASKAFTVFFESIFMSRFSPKRPHVVFCHPVAAWAAEP